MKVTCLFALLIASAPAAFSAKIGIIVPAYIYPGTTGEWQKLAEAAKEVPLTVVFNPNSGPKPVGGDASPLPGMYRPLLAQVRANTGKVFGYISTNYGQRPAADVKSDVNYYLENGRYGEIDGFFLDELPQGALVSSTLAYYRGIRDHIKSISKVYRIIGNPGTGEADQEEFLAGASPCVDELITFEQNSGYAADVNASLPWKRQHSAGHFSNLAWNVPSADTMRTFVDLAKSRNVGHIYVTDDDGNIPNSIYKNPWDTLPGYWLELVQKVKALNAAEAAPKVAVSKSAAGQATLSITGSPGVFEIQASSDLLTWATIAVVDSQTGVFTVGDPNSAGQQRRFYRLAP